MASETNNRARETKSAGKNADERLLVNKPAKYKRIRDIEIVVRSLHIMAEETCCKYECAESQLRLYEKDLLKQRGQWENQIMLCDLTKLDDML